MLYLFLVEAVGKLSGVTIFALIIFGGGLILQFKICNSILNCAKCYIKR